MVNNKIISVISLIKNEHLYLDEWLTHHLNLGIDEIFLYEDYGSKSHLDIVKPYVDRVLRRMLTNPKYKGYYCGNISYIEDYKTHKKIYKQRSRQMICNNRLYHQRTYLLP